MEVTWTDIAEVVINGLIWITAVVAIIIGCIYFNKRLKFYIYPEGDMLCLASFNNGNESCYMSIVFYAMKKTNKSNMTQIKPIKDNEFKIDISPLGEFKQVHFLIIDNFGRKYHKTFKRSNKDVRK